MPEPVGYTCPDIDACKDEVENLVNGVDCEQDFEACTVEQLKDLHETWKSFDWDTWSNRMEELRSANEALREWGNEEEERADDLEKEKDELEARVAELESE